MKVEVLTGVPQQEEPDLNAHQFDEFYQSLLNLSQFLTGAQADIFEIILDVHEEAIRYACSGLLHCGQSDMLAPVGNIEELRQNILLKVFDVDGSIKFSGEVSGILVNSANIIGGVHSVYMDLKSIDDFFDIPVFHKSAFEMGEALLSLKLEMHGLGEIVRAFQPAMSSAQQLADARSKGGKGRAEQLREKASIWKAAALKAAILLDAKHPEWPRSKLATEIAFKIDAPDDFRLPGIRQIEIWLKEEAEQPNGPIASRSR